MDRESLSTVVHLEECEDWWFCLVVIAQWSEQLAAQTRSPGFDSQSLPVYPLSSIALLQSNISCEALTLMPPPYMSLFSTESIGLKQTPLVPAIST